MGFNAGGFAGALAQTALSTYERLGEEELRDMMRQKFKKEQEQEAALDKAYSESQGRVGQADDYTQALQTNTGIGSQQAQQLSNQGALTGNTPDDIAFEKASAQSAAGAMNENKAYIANGNKTPETVAPQAALTPAAYTQNQANKDYVQAASKISRKGAMEALQMKSVTRASELEDTWDKFKTENLSKLHRIAETGNTEAFIKEAKSHGVDVRVKQNKDGSQTIQHVQDGKVVNSYGSLQEAANVAGPALLNKLGAEHFGSAKDYATYLQAERKNDIAAQEAGDKGMYYRAVANAYNTGMKGGGKETIKAKADEYADALVESKQINPKTKAPYTKEEAKTFAYDVILKNPNVKAASDWKSVPGGDGSLQENGQGQQREWDPKTKSYIIRGEVNPIVSAFANHDPNAGKEEKPKPAPAAALPVKPEVTQLRGAVSASNLRNLPLPSGYNRGNAVAKPQDSEEIRKALF